MLAQLSFKEAIAIINPTDMDSKYTFSVHPHLSVKECDKKMKIVHVHEYIRENNCDIFSVHRSRWTVLSIICVVAEGVFIASSFMKEGYKNFSLFKHMNVCINIIHKVLGPISGNGLIVGESFINFI